MVSSSYLLYNRFILIQYDIKIPFISLAFAVDRIILDKSEINSFSCLASNLSNSISAFDNSFRIAFRINVDVALLSFFLS